jgi:hypothetical protein
MPGDRPAGILILIVLAFAGLAIFRVRKLPTALATWLMAIGVAQAIAAATMIAQGWGRAAIIALINGILVAGWLVAALLFSTAARQSRAT